MMHVKRAFVLWSCIFLFLCVSARYREKIDENIASRLCVSVDDRTDKHARVHGVPLFFVLFLFFVRFDVDEQGS